MIKPKYKKIILDTLSNNLNREARFFIFGSALTRNSFDDIDIGILNTKDNQSKLSLLKEEFANSSFPYKIDLIDFEQVDENFKQNVFNNNVLWLN